ncbi:hypothetical protein JCGZ_16950 [Jatropha curcas]|uniref:Aminotransferase-like plant mobile domain-containing protein n=1 Tax=Jatropha curcas TaxID=180498 RepID=A0A067K2Y0_JATCU|nr:hypothetical protein JCGZ_16950 [Jatropha curcas]
MGRSNYKELLCALAERWWDTTNTFHFSWGELTLTPADFSVITGIPFGIRPIELYDDWRTEVSPDRMVELIGIDLPQIVESGSATPALSIFRHWLSLQAPGIYTRYRRGELTATQVARFTLLLLFASTFWSNRKEKFNPSILKSLENLAHLEEYDWAGAILSRGLVPLAWRWYKSNLHTVRRKKSLKELRTFFDTCPLEQIQADPALQRSDTLSRRRVILSHPTLRRYYLGERVDIQIRGCRTVPYSPLEDMRAGRQMTLTTAHTEGIPHVELLQGGDYDEFCGISLMPPIGSRLDGLQGPVPSQPLGTRSSRASGPSTRTPRRRPMTDPTSSSPAGGPSQAGPSRLTGPSRAPRAILEASGLLHPDLANLHLPYNISYFVPDSTPALREVSLESVDRLTLPSEDITEY